MKENSKKIRTPPGPRGDPLLGNLRDIYKSPLDFLVKCAHEYGGITRLKILNIPIYFVADHELVHEILTSRHAIFPKSDVFLAALRKAVGRGLVTNTGESHRRQRRLLQPAFHRGRMPNYSRVMSEHVDDMLVQWQDGETRDIVSEMTNLTMYIAARIFFSADVKSDARKVGNAVNILQDCIWKEFNGGILLPDWLPLPFKIQRKKNMRILYSIIQDIIRRKSSLSGTIDDPSREDLLATLLHARDENGEGMEEKQLYDEILTLFLAGHETVSTALSWFWYVLSREPEAEKKLHCELDENIQNGDFSMETLENLPYLRRCILETLRLYPSAWFIGIRESMAETSLGEYRVKKGSYILISPYAMHRLPRYFPDPERFDPDRFTPENEKKIPGGAYIPFGGGPRNCIGSYFAMTELTLLIAKIASSYRLVRDTDAPVKPEARVTLLLRPGLSMRLEKRK